MAGFGGSLGVATRAPSATLHVSGTMMLSRYTAQPVACSSSYNGMIALTSTTMAICNGTNWVLDRTNATFTS